MIYRKIQAEFMMRDLLNFVESEAALNELEKELKLLEQRFKNGDDEFQRIV